MVSLFLCICFLVCFGNFGELETGSGHLLVRKEFDNDVFCSTLGVGHNTTVTIHMHNGGDGSAYDVLVNDTAPKKFELTSGSFQGEVGEILSGESATWTYTITTNETQLIVRTEPAMVTYKRKENGGSQTAYSSVPTTRVRVIPNFEFARMVQTHYIEQLLMFGMFLFSVPAPGLVWWVKKNKRKQE